MYRYDPADFDCESLRLARDRADALYRHYRRRFCGDAEDLQQAAMMAVVELAKTAADGEPLAEGPLYAAVDRAVTAEVRRLRNREADLPEVEDEDGTVKALNPRDHSRSYPVSEDDQHLLSELRRRCEVRLGPERWRWLERLEIVGDSAADVAAEIRAGQVGFGNWRRVSAKDVEDQVAKDKKLIASALGGGFVDAVARLGTGRRSGEQQ